MSKRLFLFVVLISGSFLACQVFFGYKDLQSYKGISLNQKSISERLSSTTAKFGFSLMNCQEVGSESPKVSSHHGVCFQEGNLILLAKNKDLSPVVKTPGDVEWALDSKAILPNGLNVCLYRDSSFSKVEDSTKIFIPESDNSLPVLVVEFRNNREPFVFQGEFDSGKILNPGFDVLGTCLVFWQSGRQYIPLGVYESTEKRMVPLELPTDRAILVSGSLEQGAFAGGDGYYVLQNDYLQLVFSEKTGSIEGINLPFVGDDHSSSLVNEISFDREIENVSSRDSAFPGFSYYVPGNQKVVREQSKGGYYPLLRRGVLSAPGKKTPNRYQAFNIINARGTENNAGGYRVVEFSDKKIVFRSGDQTLTKEFRLPENADDAPYSFEVDIHSSSGKELDLWVTSGVPEVELLSNAFVPSLKSYSLDKGRGTISKLNLPKPKNPVIGSTARSQWVANLNGYFGIIMTDLGDHGFDGYKTAVIPGDTVPTRLSVIGENNDPYPSSKYPGYEMLLPLNFQDGWHKFRVYAGPLEESVLNKIDTTFADPKTGMKPDYISCLNFKGIFSFISEPFAKLLFLVMKFFYLLTGSWGISIILLTVFLKLVLYPLNAWSIKAMRRMQMLSPYIQEIQKKHKKEPKRAQAEILELYKTNKVNPLTGCLPVLIQIPFLIAMFDLLKSAFLLRGASFIPGWIDNLAAPDVIYSWKTPIFFIGNQLHLLPIALGLVMFIQQKISALSSHTKSVQTDQQRHQQAMGTMMTLLFTVMFYKFPSGLNLYWLSSMILGILQQWLTNKVLDKKHAKNEIIVKKSSKK